MAQKAEWMSKVKEEIKKSPLASNFCFGLILFGVEKITEIEFTCPCNDKWNSVIVGLLFFDPAFIVFLLMCHIQIYNEKKFSGYFFLYSFVPAILWVVLLFYDGQYIACAKTSWSGKYELLESSASQRWCNPFNSTQNEVTNTKEWYSVSKIIGLWTGFGLAVLYGLCLLFCATKKKETSGPKDNELEERGVLRAPTSVHFSLTANKNTDSKFDVTGSLDVVSE